TSVFFMKFPRMPPNPTVPDRCRVVNWRVSGDPEGQKTIRRIVLSRERPEHERGAAYQVNASVDAAHVREAHVEIPFAQRPFDAGEGEAAFDEFFFRAGAIPGVGDPVLRSPLIALLMQQAVVATAIAMEKVDAGVIAIHGKRRVAVGRRG